jgi:protein tyrosine/serine phosphatase
MKSILNLLLLPTICLSFILLTSLPALADKKDRQRDLPNFAQVSERLYRGGQPTEAGLKHLSALGINTILSLRQSDRDALKEKTAAEALGLRWFNVPMGNLERPKDEEIERTLAIINDPANGKVYIHCRRGADRTGAVVAIYRITQEGWTADQAIRETGRYKMRWWQFGKRDYIRDYEKKRRANSAE